MKFFFFICLFLLCFLQTATAQNDFQFSYKIWKVKRQHEIRKGIGLELVKIDTNVFSTLYLRTDMSIDIVDKGDAVYITAIYDVCRYLKGKTRRLYILDTGKCLVPEYNKDKPNPHNHTRLCYVYECIEIDAEAKIISEQVYTITTTTRHSLTAAEKLKIHTVVLEKLQNADKELKPYLTPCDNAYCGEIEINGHTTEIILTE